MNKSNLKSYAPQARKDFIAAVTARAHLLGLDEQGGQLRVAPAQTQGDVTIIAGQPWPAKVDAKRQQLIARMQREGFAQNVEAVAYTWFNRFAALRYMELHDYLGHGHRALSSRDGGLPEILTHASELAQAGDLPGLKASQVNELKLAGNRDGELYRLLLIAQCNALHQAMPFLFERIDDETELLLPDNLLLSDSVIAKLVAEIPEEDWAEVEIIGWLYQFYISEKKDQVIGKVVKSEDIPAATQLFTPNWIVQYLVQNSVGRLWLMANPGSTLASQWQYYIQPAEQTPEVQAQLDALIQTRVREDGETLNPETITVLDPACGSGHILVVAYDVLKAIYLERGYQPRAIPRLILEKNLYGLDIDDRAAQLAGFALLMKARADDRRLFTATDDAGNLHPPKLNVLSLQESKGLSVDELATHLAPFNVQRANITALVEAFEHAKTFGSLIQIPYALKTQLTLLPEILTLVQKEGDMYASAAADDLLPLVQQAQVLAMQFDAVVANPPYMGNRGMNDGLKDFAKVSFPDCKSDLFAMFIERGFGWCKPTGFNSMVTMQSWMFLSSYETMREKLLGSKTLSSMVHMGNGVMGIAFGTAATVFWNHSARNFSGSFSYCENGDVDVDGKPIQFPVRNERLKNSRPDDFRKIPGSPVAYWVSQEVFEAFVAGVPVEKFGDVKRGMTTSDNAKFLRFWPEVSVARTFNHAKNSSEALRSGAKWFPYSKGGGYRKWYGFLEFLINWEEDGRDVIAFAKTINQSFSRTIVNIPYYFRPSVGFSYITNGPFSMRWIPPGCLYDSGGPGVFVEDTKADFLLACMNSSPASMLLKILNPTINLQIADVIRLPLPQALDDLDKARVSTIARGLVEVSKADWDSVETSWDFKGLLWISSDHRAARIELAWMQMESAANERIASLKLLEEENNRIFINAYGLQDELTPKVPESQITLARADREKDCQRLISYAIGCMMGRYSLDEPGLIYAHAGNVGFEPGRYATFPADADGIVPFTDELWFADDACSRIREFLRAVWGPDTLEENMAWLAESLGVKGSETPDETIRRYLADKFFKDHLQTYKKRPIYWLFSSGKQGAFQALVYLHRYHEGTLARLRAEYVVPLTGKMQARLDMLQKDDQAATSTAARNKISKEIEKLKKKHLELLAYDEKLRHHADMRITLDLDDGVKVNYGKFGDLLDSVKVVTGGAGDD
ncbi:MAG: BREX-1 system adenine-specific DNA-methyltransferase PglX [Hydrogenophaga sp.]|uniref:BREX-1 system adenine-specific DNA-methyltransferase PglX n=1 Tax=Hydrogenophaga sp. TaxID=1904254 RepID=UPI0027300CCA|nr:BREX-1 system adenine-specific DNA-methyltransferase PglX [Hydrogenophaga sp.]MDP2405088.1 BREX-1 system adenine-specific DNA-methyltransferase PglX [Hydrogenophaga sp.]MDZ4176022.1 BREX-1 system adenine-specific DNA-methyltransferase PglX [Hydrogenophaga sp.]